MSNTVLLVEDNPHIMEINYEALLMEDYHVLTAYDGKSCIEQLKAEKPSVLREKLNGLRKKNKLDIPALQLEDVEAWMKE